MEPLYEAASSAIDLNSQDLHRVSDDIWRNPELHFQEHHAHAVLCDFLEKQGFAVERKYKLETALRASYGQPGSRPHVVVFCEYDALPEIGHGCGHNLIAEVGVATGIGIRTAMETSGKSLGQNKREVTAINCFLQSGNKHLAALNQFGLNPKDIYTAASGYLRPLTILGSPAEEVEGGKIRLIEAGALDGVDVAMMSHPCGYNVNRFLTLAILEMSITFTGRASHASCSPWDGINALDAAVISYQNVSCLRQQLKPNWQIHGIIVKGGDRPNIIPSTALLEYWIRAPTAGELSTLKEKVTACIQAAATATGCTVKINSSVPYLDVIINNPLIDTFTQHAQKAGVVFEDKEEVVKTVGGSTDMGNVSYVVPSIHPMYCVSHGLNAHTAEFAVASGDPASQPRTLLEAKLLAFTALDVFMDPGLLERIKADFERDIRERGGVPVTKPPPIRPL